MMHYGGYVFTFFSVVECEIWSKAPPIEKKSMCGWKQDTEL